MLNKNGFTLIEILIFTTLISVFFIVAAAVSAFSLKTIKNNENRLYATHYAEEAIEWLKNEKSASTWSNFSTVRSTGGAGRTWCLYAASIAWPTSSGSCTSPNLYIPGTSFTREVVLQTDAGSNVNATVTVSWRDFNNAVQTVTIKTLFAQFE